MINVVGLGPSDYSHLSVGADRIIRSAPIVFVRTARHPVVEELAAEGVVFKSLDYVYETADTFEEVYARIADLIMAEAGKGDVVYAVPGHPLIGESAVRTLIREAHGRGLDIRIIGSESFIEASLAAISVGMDIGLKVIDALSINTVPPAHEVGNLIYQVYDREIASDVKLALMEHYPDEFEVSIIIGAGSAEQRVQTVPLYMLDRCECDHLTTVYVPPLDEE